MNSAPGELELYGTDELVDEIVRRSTFQGIVIYAKDGVRSRDWAGERIFSIRLNENLEAEEAGRLLDVICRHIETDK